MSKFKYDIYVPYMCNVYMYVVTDQKITSKGQALDAAMKYIDNMGIDPELRFVDDNGDIISEDELHVSRGRYTVKIEDPHFKFTENLEYEEFIPMEFANHNSSDEDESEDDDKGHNEDCSSDSNIFASLIAAIKVATESARTTPDTSLDVDFDEDSIFYFDSLKGHNTKFPPPYCNKMYYHVPRTDIVISVTVTDDSLYLVSCPGIVDVSTRDVRRAAHAFAIALPSKQLDTSNHVANMLDVSTAHVPSASPDFGNCQYKYFDAGWVVWVDSLAKVPSWLRPIMDEAQKHECHIIMFDKDARCIEGLKKYEW